jgi:hypothetical protein
MIRHDKRPTREIPPEPVAIVIELADQPQLAGALRQIADRLDSTTPPRTIEVTFR